MIEKAEVAVRLAAEQMDETKPDWWSQIDPVKFDITNSDTCICGQSGLDWEQQKNVFYAKHGMGWAIFSNPELEPLWLEEIAKRMPVREPALV